MEKGKTGKHTFSISEAIHFGWGMTIKNFWFLAGVVIIPYAVSWLFSFITNPLIVHGNGWTALTGFLLMLIGLVIGIELSFSRLAVYFKVADKKKTTLKQLFWYFDLLLLWRFFVIEVLYTFIILIGLILLIVPGIYFATKYWFAPYIYVDKRTGIMESFKESARLTVGVKWQLFLLGIVQTGIIILGAFALLVGLLVALPINSISDIYIYRKLSSQ